MFSKVFGMEFIKSSKGMVNFKGPNALIFSSVFCLSTEGKEEQKSFKYVSREGCVLQSVNTTRSGLGRGTSFFLLL